MYSALEGVRGVAALLVVLFHVNDYYELSSIEAFGLKNFYLSVDLFFIISGFVIANAYARQAAGAASALNFIARRFLRLFPLHVAALLAYLGISLSFENSPDFLNPYANHFNSFLLNLCLLHGLGFSDGLSFNIPSWSVSVEFFLYLTLPTTLALLPDSFWLKRTVLVVVFFAAITVALSVRGNLDLTTQGGVARGLAGFSLGMLVASLPRLRIRGWLRPGIEVGCLVAFFAACIFLHDWTQIFAPPVFAVIVWLLVQTESRHGLSILGSGPGCYLGRISYSIYLTHYLVLIFAFEALDDIYDLSDWPLSIAAIIVTITVVLSHFTYRFIERPAREFGRRKFWTPQKAGAFG